MPMIDLYVPTGSVTDPATFARRAAEIVKSVEQVPDIPMFRDNTAAFVHEMPAGHLVDAGGAENHARVQVLTNAGALDRDKQLAVTQQLAELTAEATGIAVDRVWVLLTEAVPGGWGLWGHAHTNDEIVAAARAEIGRLSGLA